MKFHAGSALMVCRCDQDDFAGTLLVYQLVGLDGVLLGVLGKFFDGDIARRYASLDSQGAHGLGV
ncbi:hypothetical protein D3C83_197450 [compost metagenome]